MSTRRLRDPAQAGPVIPRAPTSPIECHVDVIDGLVLQGWAVNRSNPSEPCALHLIVDGQELQRVVCDRPRPDVLQSGAGPDICGYDVRLPRVLLDGAQHRMQIRDVMRREVLMIRDGVPRSELEIRLVWTPRVNSSVDGLREGGFAGWVMRDELDEPALHGSCAVRITCDGVMVGTVRANQFRRDVAMATGGPVECGFRFIPPPRYRTSRPRTWRFLLEPEGIELAGSPLVTSLVSDARDALIVDLVDAVDTLFRDVAAMRHRVHSLLPRQAYSLEDYDGWYRAYAPALEARLAASRPEDGWASGPLVSVVCPVYRPDPAELEQAIDSVLRQTWPNLELILVDDAGKRPDVSAVLRRAAERDSRVRLLVHKKNKGISGATNTAIEMSQGTWVALFDHDDVMAPVALECMMRDALKGGARVLYSDEDKVDGSGRHVEPALKPAWNHRLALASNYVCHLLLVERKLLTEVGPFDGKYDGAQDHDLVLRLAEQAGPGEIRHVPEILYHWRITASSTSANAEAKPYAAAAGEAAVRDHLARLGRPAAVEALQGQTRYDVTWTLSQEPRVTVIIPYKDQVAVTRRCLDTLLELTDYAAFDVILVDNWSVTKEAEMFAAEAAARPNVRVMRVEEPYNFSRLNNLAIEQTDAEFVVLMNNDLFVLTPGWLRACLGEALDPQVAAVGGKFLYPDGTVQHGGVIVGHGGVAGHAHLGLRGDDPGYAGRMLSAQEMSAVTAAGMLVRTAYYREVGGLDERDLSIAFNDIDLCLKFRAAGYKIIWTPAFAAEHHESLSRGSDASREQEGRFFGEAQTMRERWPGAIEGDPFYHPLFSLDLRPFQDLVDPAGQRRASLDL